MKRILIGMAVGIMLVGCGKPPCGPAGANGTNGTDGKNGSNGTDGTNGSNGVNGADGSSCSVVAVPANSVAPAGGSLITCTNGTSSLVLNGTNGINGTNGTNGSNGSNGSNGHDGANGAAGSNGTNGTVITAVQFCGGITGSYPSTFPEIGFCIDHNIYAVYSANGGFLTEVLPGTWSSDGINASCTFTVGPNCQVN